VPDPKFFNNTSSQLVRMLRGESATQHTSSGAFARRRLSSRKEAVFARVAGGRREMN
jgi:hypothetical protein